jgi:asparagine synthase (glutamine-hydrolysing)
MWKDILVEQGKLSWECKKQERINKWPLKKMLERYMPREFIYRKKSGFTPPLRRWLFDEEVAKYCKDIIFNENAFIQNIIPKNKLKRMINRVFEYQKITNYDYYELNFVWAIVFTELWLAYNRKQVLLHE